MAEENYDKTEELMVEQLKTEEKIRHVDRQIKRQKKEMKHIEASNTWKVSKPIRLLKKLFRRLFGDSSEQVQQLKAEVKQLEMELYRSREVIHQLKWSDEELSRNEVQQYIRKMQQEGELLDYLDRFIADKQAQQDNYRTALTYAARLYMNKEAPKKNALYDKIMDGLQIEEIPEFMIRAGLTEPSIPLHHVSSFRGSLNMRMRQKQLIGELPEWHLDDKRNAYEFVSSFNIRVPKVDYKTYRLIEIPKQEAIVIKPADGAGARGVYLVHSFTDIFDVKNTQTFTSWEQLLQSMEQDLETGAVKSDEWMVEELIYEKKSEKTPARDLKFYCFYGKVGLILEIIRDPEIRHCWWTADGQRITTGKYDETLFQGFGVKEEELHMVATLSEQIPAPFVRIDFLRAENGLVFGEFTPKPGNYDEFDKETDQQLGDDFIEAQGKLMQDLLEGKEFSSFTEFIQKEDVNIQKAKL